MKEYLDQAIRLIRRTMKNGAADCGPSSRSASEAQSSNRMFWSLTQSDQLPQRRRNGALSSETVPHRRRGMSEAFGDWHIDRRGHRTKWPRPKLSKSRPNHRQHGFSARTAGASNACAKKWRPTNCAARTSRSTKSRHDPSTRATRAAFVDISSNARICGHARDERGASGAVVVVAEGGAREHGGALIDPALDME